MKHTVRLSGGYVDPSEKKGNPVECKPKRNYQRCINLVEYDHTCRITGRFCNIKKKCDRYCPYRLPRKIRDKDGKLYLPEYDALGNIIEPVKATETKKKKASVPEKGKKAEASGVAKEENTTKKKRTCEVGSIIYCVKY